VREWLADHGEPDALPPMRGLEVVEEVPATHHVDGTERNALFDADRGPATADDVDRTLRWLAYARADLVALIERVAAFEVAQGPLPLAGEREERTTDDVLRHLASAEVWLLSRLDPSVRYAGDPRAGDARASLTSVRAWSVEALRTLAARHPASARTDSKGEHWTLRKVLRRLVYHALDHGWELDRRLARADGTADRVTLTFDRRPDLHELGGLIRSVGWDPRLDHPDRLERSEAATTVVVSAWDGDRLVGHARSLTDGAMTAYVSMVLVHPRWQALGLGRRIMEALLEGNDGLRIALSAAPGMGEWYERLGFEPDPRALVRRRRPEVPAR
jgi:ribosomal protein S18 acetylase RimI-like enzyme